MPFPVVNPALARALAARDYLEPTPVQTAVLVPEAEGRDLLVSAQTGSGKTVALGLAVVGQTTGVLSRQLDAPLFWAYQVVVVAVIFATTSAVYEYPRYPWTYKHVGVVEQLRLLLGAILSDGCVAVQFALAGRGFARHLD